MRKITTISMQPNVPVKEFKDKNAGVKKSKNTKGSFAALLLESCANDKTAKNNSKDQKDSKQTALPLVFPEAMLDKLQDSTAEAVPAAGKIITADALISDSGIADTDKASEQGLVHNLSDKGSNQNEESGKNNENGFKDLLKGKASEVKNENAANAADVKLEAPEAKEKSQKVDKAEAPKVSTPEPTADTSSKIKPDEFRLIQTGAKTADKTTGGKNIEIAAKAIVQKIETMSDGDKSTIKVKLHPQDMGHMEITLKMDDGKVTGKILVENREARQIFTERLSDLNQTLKDSNINAAKFEVGIGSGQDMNQGRQQSQRQIFYQSKSAEYADEIIDFDEYKVTNGTAVKGVDLLA